MAGRVNPIRNRNLPEAAPAAASAPAPEPSAPPVTRATATPARMAAAVRATTPGEPPKIGAASAAEVRAQAGAIQREWTPNAQAHFREIQEMLGGRVTRFETEKILDRLVSYQSTPGEFMAIMDKLAATPWKGKRSLAEKLMRRGIQDSNDFIVRFASCAGQKLGFWMPPGTHPHGDPRGDREAARNLREESKLLLEFFDCKNKQDFIAGLGRGVADAGRTVYVIATVLFP